MLTNLQIDENARWKQRFRAPIVAWTQVAPANLTRGLALTNASGKFQLYAWDVSLGALRQLTDRSTGLLFGELSGDGRYIYYLDDKEGNEIGHFIRIPFEGGESQDFTPGLPAYSSFGFSSSSSGSHFGFMAADGEGFHIYSLETNARGEIGAPRELFHSRKIAFGPAYSHGGEIAVIATTERATVQQYDLLAFDTTSGAQFAELWDGHGTSVEGRGFSPLPGDFRIAGTTNRSGVKRPLVWNVRTGERIDLDLPDLAGEVFPLDWSPDAERILLCQFARAVQRLYVYDLTAQTLTKLNHPGGTFGFFAGTYFGPGGEIFAQWQDAAHPLRLIALDARTGEKTRTVLAAGEVPPGRPWKSINFASSDSQVIQGWLGVPEGAGPFPTILHTHGGPEAVMTEIFGPGSQTWMDHGFAFLTLTIAAPPRLAASFRRRSGATWATGRWKIWQPQAIGW